MRLLIRWAVGAVALYFTVFLGERLGLGLSFAHGGPQSMVASLAAVLALTLVNALVRPVVKLLTLPLSCLTFGLFGLVINALMFYLVGELHVGLRVNGFLPALFGSLVTSALFGVMNTFFSGDAKREH